jgi:hypothetical protein
MKREKFLQDAKADPSRFYRNPADILRDRRLTPADRLAIVTAWEHVTREGGELIRQELRRLREQLESTAGSGDPPLPAQPSRA